MGAAPSVVATASVAREMLCGLGYWFFYGRDKLGPCIEGSAHYSTRDQFVVSSYAVTILAVLSAVLVRWRSRTYFTVESHDQGSRTDTRVVDLGD